MSKSKNGGVFSRPVDRRTFLAFTAGAGVAATGFSTGALAQANKTGVDPTKWTPEYIKSIAGTAEYDTAAECYKVVPSDYKGRLTYWYVGPTQASPQIEHDIDDQFWEAFAGDSTRTFTLTCSRTSTTTRCSTSCARPRSAMRRRWSRGCRSCGVPSSPPRASCTEFRPEEFGFTARRFWPGALKSVTWNGKTYGVPTNNETMALDLERGLFKEAGLDPENPPATWDDVVDVLQADQGQDRQGRLRHGRPRQRRQHAVPLHARSSGPTAAARSTKPSRTRPTRRMINNDGSKRGACKRPTTCMSATSRSRPRR